MKLNYLKRQLSVVLIFSMFFACSDWQENESLSGNDQNTPNQEGWKSKVIFSTDGVINAELQYEHMMRWDKLQLTTFNQGIRLDMYDEGKHQMTLTADSGEIKSQVNNLLALGNVYIVSDSGITMRTQKIIWDDAKQKIFADGFVTITTEEDTLNGYEFESDKNLNHWKMKRAFGQSGREVDLRTGTIHSRNDSEKKHNLDKEVDDFLKNEKQ
ncbi:LPS export ABC transporter periplasmic protein LptC [bacterium]|nr:LPS export ABC transporter periplasmic protein LptC [bacterium]